MQINNQLEILKIVVVYAIFGCIWIYFSDTVLSWFTYDPDIMTQISIFKGLLFILCTSLLLFFLISRLNNKIKQSTSALHNSENLLQTLIQAIPDLVWLKDKDGVYLSCNFQFERFFGSKDTEIIGKTDYDFVNRDLADFFREHDRNAMAAGKPTCNEEWITFADGGHRVLLETIKTPMYDGKENLIGVLGIGREITERKQHEQELLKIEKLESLGILAGGIAHDFNNILTGIIGNISFAKVYLDVSHKSVKPLAAAENAAVRAGELSHQLLTFARGGEPLKKVVFLRHIIEEAFSLVLSGSNVKGDVDIPDSIHAFEADEGQISQVVRNIIINATQAMPGGGTLTVNARNETLDNNNRLSLPPATYIRLTFEDQGCGISGDEISKIFDPYFTTKSAGNGLGLASAYSIISKHGGHIGVSSVVGEGTVFSIHLPSMGKIYAKHPKSISLQEENKQNGGSVLLMDDEAMVREVVETMLDYLGYEITTCADGKDAVELYRLAYESDSPFSVVILDLTIPGGLGGKQAAEQILVEFPDALLIVSSGYSSDPVMSHYRDYGFMGAINKPYSLNDFKIVLNSLSIQ